jgi:hypothetical protein
VNQVFGQTKQMIKNREFILKNEKEWSLLVILPSRDMEFEEKTKKKNNEELLAAYNENLISLQANLKEAVSIAWKFNDKPIQFINGEDFNPENAIIQHEANFAYIALLPDYAGRSTNSGGGNPNEG